MLSRVNTYTWKTAARKIRIDPIIENAIFMFVSMALNIAPIVKTPPEVKAIHAWQIPMHELLAFALYPSGTHQARHFVE